MAAVKIGRKRFSVLHLISMFLAVVALFFIGIRYLMTTYEFWANFLPSMEYILHRLIDHPLAAFRGYFIDYIVHTLEFLAAFVFTVYIILLRRKSWGRFAIAAVFGFLAFRSLVICVICGISTDMLEPMLFLCCGSAMVANLFVHSKALNTLAASVCFLSALWGLRDFFILVNHWLQYANYFLLLDYIVGLLGKFTFCIVLALSAWCTVYPDAELK